MASNSAAFSKTNRTRVFLCTALVRCPQGHSGHTSGNPKRFEVAPAESVPTHKSERTICIIPMVNPISRHTVNRGQTDLLLRIKGHSRSRCP